MSVTSTKSSPAAPLPFKITSGTQLEDWKKWQRSFRYYANSINLEQECHDVQLCIFKSLLGPDAMNIYNTFSLLDITDVESVIRKFDKHFKPKVNVTLERYKLYKLNQKPGQRFDDFLSDITNQVDKCEFNSVRDEIVLYKIVGGIDSDEVRNALLAESDLNYDKAVPICRASSAMHLISGKENVCKSTAAKKKEELGKTPKVSYKKLESETKDREVDSEIKVKTSKAVQKQSDTEKVAEKGSVVEECLKDHVVQKRSTNKAKKVTKAQPAFENVNVERSSTESEETGNKAVSRKENSGSDDSDSDWRADDIHDDYDHVDSEVENVKRRRSKKKTPQKNGEPGETREKAKSFPCLTCGRAVSSKRDLKRHNLTHVQGGKVTCHHCGGRYKQMRYLVRHIVRSHPGIIYLKDAPKIYICEVCDYKTYQVANMRRHKYQHTEDRPFSCELCEYKCIVPRLMKAHMAKHTGEKPLVCSACPKGFIEHSALKKHMLTHMSPEEREKRLAEERESSSRPVGPSTATCETCGKVFSSRGALKTHSVVHTGERPFACTVCDYRAGQKAALNAHMAKHSEEKPFVCTVCGYSCKLKRVLQVHMNTHTGDRPYACNMCDSRFKQIAHLQVHVRTHTGEKPYVCDICGHRWAKQSNLTQHMKIHQNQTGDPSQYTPPRKRQKKRKSDTPTTDPAPAPANAIPQWSEQVSTINPMECFLNLETPPPFHPTYPAPQVNPRPPDCRYFQQRQTENQTQNHGEHFTNP